MKKLTLTFIILLLSLATNIVIAERGDTLNNATNQLSAEELENEKKINNVIAKEARISAQTNPGFRDLKPGVPMSDYYKNCTSVRDATCYGIQNIKFNAILISTIFERNSSIGKSKHGVQKLGDLILDMGPIVASDGSFFSQLNNLVVSNDDEPNIYLKMKSNLDAKYVLDYEYSERDRQLFNENVKDELLGVYSNGQVVLRINRKERDYSKDLWLYIEYRDVDSAKSFLEKNRPATATLDDF